MSGPARLTAVVPPPDIGTPPLPSPGGPRLPNGDPDGFDVMPDITLSGFTWYIPTFRLVPPTAQSSWPPGPFGYSFVTGHNAAGEPSIAATITLQVQAVLSDGTKAKIPDLTASAPVVPDQLRAVLDIPYLDDVKGSLTTTSVAATRITATGDVQTLVFEVAGDLARAAYGSLSRPGYQPVPLRLRLELDFTGYWWTWIVPPRGTQVELRPERAAPPEEQSAALVERSAALVERSALLGRPALLVPERPPPVDDGGDDPVGAWTAVSRGQTQTADVLVPCADHAQLYVDTTDAAHPVSIGCQDSMALGRLPNRLYSPLDDLATADYEVLGSLTRPAVYLVLPRRYRIGRATPGLPGVKDWSPLVRWIEVFDATHDGGLPCRLQASLQPDLAPARLADLRALLAVRAGQQPTLLLPTDYGSGMTAFTVTGWNTGTPVRASVSGSSIQLGAELSYTDAVVVNAMLGSAAAEGQLVGNAAFGFSDGSSAGPVELHVDVVSLTGPWPDGPVLVDTDGVTATVRNHAENTATVTRLLELLPDGSSRVAATGLALAVPADGSAWVPVTAAAGAGTVADHTLAASTAAVVDQQRLYIEDLHTTITVVNDANMGTAGITGVDVLARLDGDPHALAFSLAPGEPLFQLDLVQPLVADRQSDAGLLHLSATVHRIGQPDRVTGDLVVDLHQGVVIRLSAVLAAP